MSSERSHYSTDRLRNAAALIGLLLQVACSGPDPDTLNQLVMRFAGAKQTLSVGWPIATIRDDTRYVLRAPAQAPLTWATQLDDRTGNRLYTLRRKLPPELHEASALLVTPSVKIGAKWVEPPPRVIQIDRNGPVPSVEVDIGIPANPELRPVIVTARALGIDAVQLETIRIRALTIPEDARLEFSIGVVEPDWGSDPVAFSVEACKHEACETIYSHRFEPDAADRQGWRDESVSLAALAGKQRHFRFLAKRRGSEGSFSFPVWANPTVYVSQPRNPERVNVILLSIDTLRADHLTSYGYRHDTAPFIEERFGRGGTVFDHMVASATITTPSHASMFTALSPPAHGAVHGVKILPRRIPTLAEIVRRKGIDTAAFTEDGWLGVQNGFGRGFDRYVENKSSNIMDPDGQADRTFAQARAWLEANADKHFFLFLHTFQVHTPYAPPPEFQHLFLDHGDAEPGPHLEWMAQYDQEIRYTDGELERLFESIDHLRLAENTVFILTSDHGEAFMEHGVLEHGSRLDEEIVHVPLMFWGRGIPAGRRIHATTSHVDLMPTILELLGVEVPKAREGLSLAGLARGNGNPKVFERRPVFSESRLGYALGPNRVLQPFPSPSFLVRVGGLKLARYPQNDGAVHYELYDVHADPRERNDLFDPNSDASQQLIELVESYDERGKRIRAKLTGHAPAEPPEQVFLDPRQQQKLRALGYLE